MELEKVIQTTVENMVKSGSIEKMVEKHLEKTVEDIVSDSLRTYGDFGKQVKEAVNSCFNIDLSSVKMIDLSFVINKTIKDQLESSVNANILKSVESCISELTGELEKKEWKISEVIEKLKESADSWDRNNNNQITLIAEIKNESYGKYVHYYFDYKSNVDKYSCSYRLDVKLEDNGKFKIYNFKGGKLKRDGDIRFSPIFGSFDKFLFRLHASSCSIINDSDEVNEYYEDEY